MNEISNIFSGDGLLLVMKAGAIVVSTFYVIFSFVIVRQVNKMTETLSVGFENTIRFISLLHLLVAVGVLLIAFIIL